MLISNNFYYYHTELQSFDSRLVQFIADVLQDMGDNTSAPKEWAFEEALNYLHISGTFRNSLSQRLDNILVPILVKIIGLIDKNFNLSIIYKHHDKMDSPIARLWLEIFADRNLCKLGYEDVFTDKNKEQEQWVPGIGASRSEHYYKCCFPFSWLCREAINLELIKLAGINLLDFSACISV